MTEQERLEEIINDITFVAKSYNGVEPLIEYAKEQAERVQELEEQVEFLNGAIETKDHLIEFAQQKIRETKDERNEAREDYQRMLGISARLNDNIGRYREALGRIANHEIYGIDIRQGDELVTDAGEIARQALEESE